MKEIMDNNTIEATQITDLEVLQFYSDCGVDDAVLSAPVNRYMSEPTARIRSAEDTYKTPAENSAAAATPIPAPAPSDSASSKELAAQCQTLDELRQVIEAFNGCSLKNTAKNTVFADGNPDAPIMFIGEAPGRDEDIQGLPFVGAAGQLLNRMLAAIGRDRNSVYISNILNWRPPGNRTPTLNEAMTCLPFIRRHVQLAAPKVVVLLGGTSAKYMLDTNTGIMRLRGKWTELMLDEFGEQTIPALPTLHPAYLLRQPAHKRLAWKDFLEIQARLKDLG